MNTTSSDALQTRCCIAGGGPAGVMLGVLLARAGIDVIVLEKHADFLRDFRGDTVHPSTLEVMYELGWLEDFLRCPHQQVREVGGRIADQYVTIADFSHLPTRCRFIALMPQWDFLDFLAERGRRYPTFRLIMRAEVVDLLEHEGMVTGVVARTPDRSMQIQADLTVGADGRHSVVRERARLVVDDFGVPIDVLWLRLRRQDDDPQQILGNLEDGHVFVMLNRGDYWQCAYVIPKGGYEELRRKGLETFRDSIAQIVPFLRDRVGDLTDWDQIKPLTVMVNRLRTWHRPGLLCIGDAAHAMSPIGGVGINLAIQDAVAAANRLAAQLKHGGVSSTDLAAVQRRREFPTRATQRAQLFAQNRIIRPSLGGQVPATLPWPVRLLRDYPVLRRLPARIVGLGFRPEHVRTPDVFAST